MWSTQIPILTFMVTMEPRNDLDPKPAWSNAVGAYYLAPPFGK